MGSSGLFYAVGALGTAFAVDYWLSNKKMEEELARDSDSISEEKAETLLENTEGVDAESKAKTPAEVTREPSKTEEELVETLKAEITEPCVEEVCQADNLDFSEGELEVFVEPEKEVCVVETTEEKSVLPELPFALWKIFLAVALALLWACARPETFMASIPTLNEEFEADTILSIPMLGFNEDVTTTAVAVAVDELEATNKTKTNGEESTELELYIEDDEEKWGIFALIVLAMMVL